MLKSINKLSKNIPQKFQKPIRSIFEDTEQVCERSGERAVWNILSLVRLEFYTWEWFNGFSEQYLELVLVLCSKKKKDCYMDPE